MMEDTQIALAILERAITVEQEGRRFYLKAAQTTQDGKGRETFVTLAQDEKKHYNLIRRQHDALTREGKWIGSPGIKAVNITLDKPLFPKSRDALKKAITTKSGDWDALLFGLDIEIRSYDLYRKAAGETNDPLGKQMFVFLTGEERGHFDILMMRYDLLFGPVAWSA